MIAPLLGTPDSRITSFEIGTTKSCATIPEDDELELDDEELNHTVMQLDDDEITTDGDLVSIDRVIISIVYISLLINIKHTLDLCVHT